MALEIITEDGTGLIESNSYISLEDADSYFETRLNSGIWNSETDDNKTISLIQATRALDNYLTFKGIKWSDSQSLEFPRISDSTKSYLKYKTIDTIGDYFTYPEKKLKQAVCEMALYMLKEDVLAKNDLLNFKSLAVAGAVTIETKDKMIEDNLVPEFIFRILSDYAVKKSNTAVLSFDRG